MTEKLPKEVFVKLVTASDHSTIAFREIEHTLCDPLKSKEVVGRYVLAETIEIERVVTFEKRSID